MHFSLLLLLQEDHFLHLHPSPIRLHVVNSISPPAAAEAEAKWPAPRRGTKLRLGLLQLWWERKKRDVWKRPNIKLLELAMVPVFCTKKEEEKILNFFINETENVNLFKLSK